MRKVNRIELANLLKSNVCEIVFIRRRPERTLKQNKFIRRMLCCNSNSLLNSINGITNLSYRKPKGPKKINEAKHNVVVTWDIMMKDYRNVSMDNCFLVNQYPANDTFWKFFAENIYIMSPEQQQYFMETLPQ
jgi:hypothetical protein